MRVYCNQLICLRMNDLSTLTSIKFLWRSLWIYVGGISKLAVGECKGKYVIIIR
jgi:hypothetical protein